MKAKLIKTNDEYRLYVDDVLPYATSDNSPYKRLSKQNCDEIFGVVDVEKLAEQEFDRPYIVDMGTNITPAYQDGFKIGFNKAMELNKDKVFTLEDMNNAMDWIMTQYFEFHEQPTTGRREQYLESIQQPTEIDVEIEMEYYNPLPPTRQTATRPKLDSEGCLILKKI